MKELTWHQRGRLWWRLGLRLVLFILALVFLAQFAQPLISLFAPFILALVAAWMLSPVVRFFQQKCHIPRKLTSLVLILLAFGLLAGLLWMLCASAVGEVVTLAENWNEVLASFTNMLDNTNGWFNELFARLPETIQTAVDSSVNELMDWLRTAIPQLLQGVLTWAGNVATGVPSFAVATLAFVMGAYFISADYPRLRYMLDNKLPEGPRFFLLSVRRAAAAGFGGYFKAQLILSMGVFAILLVGFLVMGQPYALLLAFLLAVLDFIPIFGSGTAMVPWAVVDLFTGNISHAIWLMAVWGVVAVFRQVGSPRVLGNQTGLSPILSLISVYVGMRLGGVMGMVLGPVLCLVILNICRSGILDQLIWDLKLAAGDISAVLRSGKGEREDSEEDSQDFQDM